MPKSGARFGLLALAALGATVAGSVASAELTLGAKQGARPNIILVVTDDQTLAAFNARTMPYTVGAVAGAGTTFNNTIAVTPLCCPSRAAMITGQYGHNNGIVNNKPGYPALVDKKNVLPAWLQAAGYHTAHVGRYLSYDLQVGRETIEFGKKKKDYITRVLNSRAVQVIRKQASKPQPLYLQLDQFAPHAGPGTAKGPCAGRDVPDPDPADYAQFANEPLPTPPSFNEEDISDKPSFVTKVPPLTEKNLAAITQRYRCALASLVAVDRGMAAIDAALAQAGELDNTVVMFMSDNGFFNGEHRLPREKIRPYEEGLRNYGSLFVGENTTVPFGDKCVGTNHTLPTSGAARYTGGLWVGKYLKTLTYQRLTPEASRRMAVAAGAISRAENMPGHAISAEIRLEMEEHPRVRDLK